MFEHRLSRVAAALAEQGLTQTLVCDPMSIKYLTGYYTAPYERFLGLLIFADTPQEPVLFANALFPPADTYVPRVVVFSDTDNPVELVAQHIIPGQTLGVDRQLSARWLVPLMGEPQVSDVVLGSFAVDQTRSVKDAEEQQRMREASALNDKSIDWLIAQLHVGVTEKDIAERLLGAYRELGADGFSFDPIVSFGENNADPHHEPDDTQLKEGDVVLFDVGCARNGYMADMTRCVFFGEPGEEARHIYDVVRAANEAAEALVKPGITFAELDQAARKVIEDAGYGPYFTHRLGHQIGLETHEPGDVSSANHTKVKAGQIFSIEPGVYVPGKTGVRIEDLVLVTEDGCEILNSYTKEPTTIKVC